MPQLRVKLKAKLFQYAFGCLKSGEPALEFYPAWRSGEKLLPPSLGSWEWQTPHYPSTLLLSSHTPSRPNGTLGEGEGEKEPPVAQGEEGAGMQGA